jgi:hypothetical protein
VHSQAVISLKAVLSLLVPLAIAAAIAWSFEIAWLKFAIAAVSAILFFLPWSGVVPKISRNDSSVEEKDDQRGGR